MLLVCFFNNQLFFFSSLDRLLLDMRCYVVLIHKAVKILHYIKANRSISFIQVASIKGVVKRITQFFFPN